MDIIPITNKSRWDQLMENCRHQDLQQLWDYGECLKQCYEWQPVRHEINKNNDTLAIAQTVTKSLPGIGTVARTQNGPMFLKSNENIQKETYLSILEHFSNHWTMQENCWLHFTPCLYASEIPENWMKELNLFESKEPLWNSIYIDLQQPTDVLWRNMRRTGWREVIQKAQKSGLSAEWTNEKSVFFELLDQYKQKQKNRGFYWPPAELVQTLWECDPNSFFIISIKNNNQSIAKMACYTFFSTSFCLISWSDDQKTGFYADQFMFWETILHFQNLHYSLLDLGGIDPINLPGITHFKRGLHGEEYQWAGNAIASPPDSDSKQDFIEKLESPFSTPLDSSNLNESATLDHQVENLVAAFLQESYGNEIQIDSNQSLINSGMIDSLSIVSFVQKLQSAFDIDVYSAELTVENFDTIHKISQFVKEKQT